MKEILKNKARYFIQFELTQALYQSLRVALLGLWIVSTLIAWQLNNHIEILYLGTWYLASLTVIVLRLILFFWYQYTQHQNHLLKYHHALFVLGSCLSAVLLGMAGSLLMPEDIADQSTILILISGVVAGAVQSLSASFFAVLTYIYLTLLPVLIWEYIQIQNNQVHYVSIFIAMSIFTVYSHIVSRRRSLVLSKHLELEYNYKALLLRVSQLRDKYKEKAIHDILTGLYNRQFLDDFMEIEISKAKRKNKNLAILLLDIDFFKQFNDTYGHLVGDAILQSFGNVLNSAIRRFDIAARFGGEEFILLLSEISLEEAFARAESIRKNIKKISIKKGEDLIGNISASVGVAIYPEDGETKEALFAAADKALYQAKESGRDRVCVAQREKSHK